MSILLLNDIIPTFFRKMSSEPRKYYITVIGLCDGCIWEYFFSENIAKTDAGVAKSYLTEGVCCIVDGGYLPNTYGQILDENEVKRLFLYKTEYTHFRTLAKAAMHEDRIDDYKAYRAQFKAVERAVAEEFNAVLELHPYAYRNKFLEFPAEPQMPLSGYVDAIIDRIDEIKGSGTNVPEPKWPTMVRFLKRIGKTLRQK